MPPTASAAKAPPIRLLAALALVLVTFVAYVPAFRAGFIWDDDAHLTAPALRSLAGLGRIWAEPGATQQYYPLLHSAFWLEHRLWGGAPLGYHLANVALHACAAVLFALLLCRLLGSPVGPDRYAPWLAALLFAVHPLHVESVAWISEQKNTLSLVLYLAAALAYLRFEASTGGAVPSPRPVRLYALATALFVCALLAKTVTATLPAALLVVFWWQRGTLTWRRDVLPLVPWFVLGACAGLFTAWAERKLIGAEGAAYDLSLVQRALLAGRVVWFYLGQFFVPLDLIFIHPRWRIDPAVARQWLPLLGALGLALGLWLARTRSRAPLAAFLFFVGSLFPVLGFFNLYPFVYAFVADHFAYLASLGLCALAAGALARLERTGLALGLVLALGLAALTWRHARDFQDNVTLFRATLARNPGAWMAHNNLGQALLRDPRRAPEAITCFERALALRPDYFEARNNLGLALAQAGRPAEALPHLEAALRLKPDSFQTLNNLGIALAGLGRAEEAVAAFRRAVRLNPALPNSHENLAKALLLAGRADEAAAARAAAARLRAAAH